MIFSFVGPGIWLIIVLFIQLILQEFVFSLLFLNITYNQTATKHFPITSTDDIKIFSLSVGTRSVPVSK